MLRAKNFGSGLLQLGLVPGEGTRVAVLLRNCPEWTIAELGLFMLVRIIITRTMLSELLVRWSMVSVPLFSKLGPASTSYILAGCEVTVAVAWDDVSIRSLLDCVPISR